MRAERRDTATSPLVIGGTGGSGTGVAMMIVRSAGRFMGTNLNEFGDALDLAAFDWRWGWRYVRARATGTEQQLSARMASEHSDAVRRHLAPLTDREPPPWGWKHPHSYLLLPFLNERHPDLRFLHIVRDGRDMAFSQNQQQAEHYGPLVLRNGREAAAPAPLRSAAYWAWANTMAAEDGCRHLGERYLCLRFEDLCAEPREAVARLVRFAGGPAEGALVAEAAAEISVPASVGRWREADPVLASAVSAAARPALRRFGYGQ